MKVSVGSDHRGVDVRQRIVNLIRSAGNEVMDCGTHSSESCDYPDIAQTVACSVGQQETDRGVLVCGSGIGVSIAANKVHGIRAALCHDAKSAEMSRRHNDANVLCLSADRVLALEEQELKALIETWLETPFEGGRHQRRVDKISSMDRSPPCNELT